MAEEDLRIQVQADVKRAQAALKQLQQQLRETAKQPQVANLTRELTGMEKALHGAGRGVSVAVLPAFHALRGLLAGAGGITGLIAGVTYALKGMSEAALDLQYLSRETGLSEKSLKAWGDAAQRARIDAGAMQSSFRKFSDLIGDLRTDPSAIGKLPPELRQFGQELKQFGNDTEGALRRVFQFIEQQRDPANKRWLAEQLLGDPALARLTFKQFEEALARVGKETAIDTEKAKSFYDRIVDLQRQLANLGTIIGNQLLSPMSELVKRFTDFVEGPAGKGMAERITGIGNALAATNWQKVGADVQSVASGFVSVAESIAKLTSAISAAPPEVRGAIVGGIAGGATGAPFGLAAPGAVTGAIIGAGKGHESRFDTPARELSFVQRWHRAESERLRKLEEQLLTAKRETEEHKKLTEQIEASRKQLRALEETIRRLNERPKPQSFLAPGGGAPIILPASFRPGGATHDAFRGFRAGGMRGGSFPMPGAGDGVGAVPPMGGRSADDIRKSLGMGGTSDAMAPAGTSTSAAGDTEEITTKSGAKFQVAREFAPNFRGFLRDYEKAGGVIQPGTSGGLSTRPGNASYHPLGRAIDINQVGRNVIRGGLPGGIAQEEELARKWGLRAGSSFRNPDRGHFEVNSRENARNALIAQGVLAPDGSSYVQRERARVMAQLQEPGMRDLTAAVLAHEQGDAEGRADVLESLVNRSVRTGKHPRDLIRNGFYGPVNRGAVDAMLRRGVPAWALGDFDYAAKRVGGGSDVLGGRDDQGMPHEVRPDGRISVRGESYGFLSGASRSFAARRAREIAEDARRLRESGDRPHPFLGARDRLSGFHEDELQRARESLVRGGGSMKIEGRAGIDVNVNAPAGTKVRTRASGIFRDVKMERSVQRPHTPQGPPEELAGP